MKLDRDVIELGAVPDGLLSELQQIIPTIDWRNVVYNRSEASLMDARMIRIPYNIKKEPEQPVTTEIALVREAFKSIQSWLETVFNNHVFIKCELNWVTPDNSKNTDISTRWLRTPMHRDSRWFHEHSHRIHIPVITNDNCLWVSENSQTHLESGKFYEVDNRAFHTIINDGETGRLHIVLDVMDKDIFDQASSTGENLNRFTFSSKIAYRTLVDCLSKAKFLVDYNSK